MSNNIERYVDSLISKFGKSGLIRALDLAEEKFRHFDETSKGMINKLADIDLNEASLERLMRFGKERTGEILIANNAIKKLKGLLSETNLGAPKFEEVRNDTILLMKSFDELRGKAQGINKGFNLGIDYSSSFEGISRAYKRKEQEEKRLTEQKKQEEVAARQTERAAKEEAKQAAREQAQAAKQAAKEQAQAAKEQERVAKEAAAQRIKADTLKRDWFTSNSTFSGAEFKEFDKKINQLKKAKEQLSKKGANSDDILSLNNEIEKLKAINERVKQLRESLKLAGKDTNLANNIKNEISAAKLHYDNIIKGISSKNLGVKLPSTFENDLTTQISGGKLGAIKDLCAQIGGVIAGIGTAVKSVVSVAVSAFQKIAGAIKTCVSALKTFASAIPKLLSLMSNFGNRVRSIFSKIGNILSSSFDNFLNNKYVSSGLGVLQSIQTLNTVIGNELTENTINWANSLENAFGLSASGLVADLKQISGILYGLGMKSNETYDAGRNLLMVGSSLSNILGYSQEEVITKISSGLKGMTQSVDDLGLSVREEEMNSFLKELKAQGGIYSNIATSFSNLNEEQRVYVRYAALMKQYMDKYNADTYVKSLDTITGRINILKNQIRTFISAVGQLFLQLFDRIIKPLILVVNYLVQGINYVAGLLDIDLGLSSDSNGGAFENVKNGAEEAADSVDGMTESLEEAKGALDELDHITNLNSSSGGSASSGSSAFDYSLLMDLGEENNKQLADIMEDINKETKNYFDGLKTEFPELTSFLDKLSIVLNGLITGDALTLDKIIDLGGVDSIWVDIYDIALGINSIFETIGDIFGTLLDDLVKWLKDEGIDIIKGFIDKIDKFLKDNKDVIIRIIENIAEVAFLSIETFLDLVLALLNYIVNHEDVVNNILELLKGLLRAISDNADGVVEFVVQFGLLAGLFSGIIGLLTGSGGLIAALGGLVIALETLLFSEIFKIADEKVAPRRNLFEAREEQNYADWEEWYKKTYGQAAPRDKNGKLIIPQSVQDKMIKNLENDVDKIAPEWWQAGARLLTNADESGALKMNTSAISDADFEKKYGSIHGAVDAVNFSIDTWKNGDGTYTIPNLQKENTKSVNVQTEATNSNTKSLDEVISMGYELKDVGTDLVATYTKTDDEIKNAKSLDDLIAGKTIKSTRSISGYANGGIPKSGSLFFANENGNSELIGNFGGYSGVANNQMIMSSIQNGVYQAVKKALAESNGSSQTNNITVAPDGLFIGDEASIRKLATLINNANRKSNQNIANTGYVM